jgi:alpha-1,6-mannosyltransferase
VTRVTLGDGGGRRAALLLAGGAGTVSLLGYAAGVPWLVAASPRPHVAHIGLFGALFLIYLLSMWIILRRPLADPLLVSLVLGFGLLFRLSLLGTPVLLSSDLYRYFWDGRVQWAGISPYRYAPDAPELAFLRDQAIHPHINRPMKPTVYPPGAQAVFALVARVAPDSIPAWRAFLLASDVVTGALLLALLRRMGAPAAVIVYAWSPLVVFEGVQAGHLDLVVIPLVLAALLWRQAGSSMSAGVALGAAVLMKLYPVVLVPAWWRPRDWRFPATVAATVALGYVPHAAGVGLGALGFLPEYLGRAEDHNIGLRALLTYPLALTDEMGRAAVMALMFALMAVVLIAIGQAKGDDPAALARAGTFAIGSYLLLVPTSMHPWYVLWIVPFLCLWPSPPWLFFSGAVVLSYMSYVVDPAPIPWWAWLAEYGPLYALLILSGVRALTRSPSSSCWWPSRRVPAALAARDVGGQEMASHTPRGSGRAGDGAALLDSRRGS